MSTDQPRDPAVKHVSAHFYIDAPLHEGLKAIKERDGVSEAEQMRRGIKLYLESKGYTVKTPKRARKGARKR